jgi:hypothetical protein
MVLTEHVKKVEALEPGGQRGKAHGLRYFGGTAATSHTPLSEH